MANLTENYNVVSASDVTAWVVEDRPLPPRAALVTFDDGYFDNYSNAYPILRKRNLPAVIFLASDYMESATPFYWDLVAHCFFMSQKDHLDFPSLGNFSWSDEASKDAVVRQVVEILKAKPERDKKRLSDSFPKLLNVSVSDEVFKGMFLSWSQVREMRANGIEMGAHTASHPILTRIHPDDARAEIVKSKKRIEDEVKQPVHCFAYPNGQRTDYNDVVIRAVRDSGIQSAYTLLPGPTRFASIKKRPYQIRRIFLSYKDTLPRFAAKLSGLSRLSL
ncbi:MAG: polysaccharide deacetylase family protein [Anaerolineales bacterium]|nr:polysaccharide deacetylase family protein [Anaerolineales bacterium]